VAPVRRASRLGRHARAHRRGRAAALEHATIPAIDSGHPPDRLDGAAQTTDLRRTSGDPAMPQPATPPTAPPGLRIGHVHLKVAELDRALRFWRDIIGLEVQQSMVGPGGRGAVFLSAGGYHHHIALNTWESAGGAAPAPGTTGLYHVALLYPDRPALAAVARRVLDAGLALDGASDHGVSEALYLRDADGNGVELYRDRPEAEWPRDASGRLAMVTRRLDFAALLAEAG